MATCLNDHATSDDSFVSRNLLAYTLVVRPPHIITESELRLNLPEIIEKMVSTQELGVVVKEVDQTPVILTVWDLLSALFVKPASLQRIQSKLLKDVKILPPGVEIPLNGLTREPFLLLSHNQGIEGAYYGALRSNELKTLISAITEETLWEALVQSEHDSVWVTDGDGRILRVSAASKRISGVVESEAVGKTVDELEKQGVINPSATRIALNNKRVVTIIQVVGQGKCVFVTAIPLINSVGEITRVVNITRDVTGLIEQVIKGREQPFEIEKLKQQLRSAQELAAKYSSQLEEMRRRERGSDPIFRSPGMARIKELVGRVAVTDSTVMILGESGVGKTMLAKRFHQLSNRSSGPFVEISCGAIPEQLLESELFGYEPGSFTGAVKTGKKGLCEIANGGTLFLDEIGDLPLTMQTKILKLIQDSSFLRVGGLKPIFVDIRIIAATHKDLHAMTSSGEFRKDLFYRLNVVPITIPPLRERIEDISALAFHFLDSFSSKYGLCRKLSGSALKELCNHKWPGNIRELENTIERLVITAEGQVMEGKDVLEAILAGAGSNIISGEQTIKGMAGKVEQQKLISNRKEKMQAVAEAMKKHGSTRKAAQSLGISQSTVARLWRLINNGEST